MPTEVDSHRVDALMVKREERMPDGRLLIYYSFKNDTAASPPVSGESDHVTKDSMPNTKAK